MPKVTVLMAVHNGEPFLAEAIESILGQSFEDFEFLVVEDASTDASQKLITSFADPRLRLISNREQLGLSRSLNKGLEQAAGQYVARMDHDDISLPQRLKMQVDFLDLHADIDVLGTWARTLGLSPQQTWRYPTRDDEIRSEFIFNSSLVHGSVMLRKETFDHVKLRYDPEVTRAQDYELWIRAAPNVQFANLNTVLLRYRIHDGQVGRRQNTAQQGIAEGVRLRLIQRLGIEPNASELQAHNQISRWEAPQGRAELEALESWFLKLRAGNKTSEPFPASEFDKALDGRWRFACRANIGLGLPAWHIYKKSELARSARKPTEMAIFWTKAALRSLGWRAS